MSTTARHAAKLRLYTEKYGSSKAAQARIDEEAMQEALRDARHSQAESRPAGTVQTAPKAGGPVDWDLWSSMPTARIGEAVALSLGCHPGESLPPSPAHFPAEYRKRLRIAEAHLNAGTALKSATSRNGRYGALVDLREFGSWVLSMGWDLPDEFPHSATQTATPDDRSLGTRERNTLLTIIATLAKEAGIALDQTSKTAESIANAAEMQGLTIARRTIEEKLKLIPDAIAARSK